MEAIISSAITGVVALIVCVLNNHYQQNQTRKLIEYKIEELTKRVDKHNNVIQRTYMLEQKEAIHDEQIKGIRHIISNLEKVE